MIRMTIIIMIIIIAVIVAEGGILMEKITGEIGHVYCTVPECFAGTLDVDERQNWGALARMWLCPSRRNPRRPQSPNLLRDLV